MQTKMFDADPPPENSRTFGAEDDVHDIDATLKWKIVTPEQPIGEGTFARVWDCRRFTGHLSPKSDEHPSQDGCPLQSVHLHAAVKILSFSVGDDNYLMRRFSAEGKALVRLTKTGVTPRLLDFDKTETGRPFLVTEKIDDAWPLVDILMGIESKERPGITSLEDLLRLFEAICRSVQKIHDAGWVHRDLSWTNIMAKRDGANWQVFLIDFGLSDNLKEPLDPSLRLQDGIRNFGTPHLMPPEHAFFRHGNLDVSATSDVYSIGALLYWALLNARIKKGDDLQVDEPPYVPTSELPTKPGTPVVPSEAFGAMDTKIRKLCAERLKLSPNKLRQAFRGRGGLDHVLTKAVAWKKSERFQSAHEMGSALFRVRTRASRRNKWIMVSVAAAAAAVAIVAAGRGTLSHLKSDSQTKDELVIVEHDRETKRQEVDELTRQVHNKTDQANQLDGVIELLTHGATPGTKLERQISTLEFLSADLNRINALSADPRNQVELLKKLGTRLLEMGRLARAEKVFQFADSIAGKSELEKDDNLRGELTALRARALRDTHDSRRLQEVSDLYEAAARYYESANNKSAATLQRNEKKIVTGKPDDSGAYMPVLNLIRGKDVYEEIRQALEQTEQQAANGQLDAAVQIIVDAAKPYDESIVTHRLVPTALINLTEIDKGYPLSHEAIMLAAEHYEKKLHPDPVLESAYVDSQVGRFYMERGDYEKAQPYLKSAIELGHKLLDTTQPDHHLLLIAEMNYGLVLRQTAKGDPTRLDDALRHATFARNGFEATNSLELAEGEAVLASIEAARGHKDDARKHLTSAQELYGLHKVEMVDWYQKEVAEKVEAATKAVNELTGS